MQSPPTVFPSERTTFPDPATAATIIQWTRGPHKNQHLYFTSLSVTADDRWLTLISDRTGHPNLFAIDRRTGAIRRLSNNHHGLLRSYVYPRGGLTGLSKSSPVLDPHANRLYYIRNDTLYRVALDSPAPPETLEEKICDIPAGWYTAFTHISPDGKTVCVPCTDPRAFADDAQTQWDQLRTVPLRIRDEKLTTRIYLIDTRTGHARLAAAVPFWVTHVQFDPANTGRIVFNQEGFLQNTGLPVTDRIWCLETTGRFRPLAPEAPGEWRTHENWAPDGQSIIYHGGRDNKPFLAARTWDGQLLREISMQNIACYHATPALDGRRLFIDRKDGLIALVDPSATPPRMLDLCRHDTTVEDQDAHAHPISTPSGRSLIFTSNRAGNCNVYEVLLPPAAVSPAAHQPIART